MSQVLQFQDQSAGAGGGEYATAAGGFPNTLSSMKVLLYFAKHFSEN